MIAETGAKIDTDAFYDDLAVYATLKISGVTLAKARKATALRFVRQGNRILYRGSWLLDWLDAASTNRKG